MYLLHDFLSVSSLSFDPDPQGKTHAGIQTISAQYDLATLPEPRFISTAPFRQRCFAMALLFIGALFGGSAFVAGLADSGNLFMAASGAIALVVCLSVLIYLRPDDWRAWIGLAATPEGLFLVASARQVVFAPWQDVIDIALVSLPTGRGIVNYARLTLRLSEANWSRFGNLSGIEGSGPVRQYTLGALAVTGEVLVEGLRKFRAAHG